MSTNVMWIAKKLKPSSGFTLLEVLIAFSIFFVTFSVITGVITGSLRDAARTRERNVVGLLAKRKMIEVETAIESRAFSDFKTEDTGTFEEPYQDYVWKYEVKELEFPSLSQIATSGLDTEDTGGGAGNQMGKLITKYLSQATREVRVTIQWPSGKTTPFEYTLTQLWVNLNNEFQLTE